MEACITILREVRDPRDFNARHDCAAMLFISLIATLCGAKSCVDIADFAAANVDDLAEIVDLPHGAPSHDSFSRLFRLLDPDEMSKTFQAFAAALSRSMASACGAATSADAACIAREDGRQRPHSPRRRASTPS